METLLDVRMDDQTWNVFGSCHQTNQLTTLKGIASRMLGSTPQVGKRGIFSYTPEPHIAFCPILSTHFFPCLNPIFKNGSFLSVVALVSVTLLDSKLRPSADKRSNLTPTPSSSLARTATIELPECQERRGAKTI